MKVWRLTFFLIVLMVLGCTHEEIPSVSLEEPKRLLPRDSFVLFMSDVHIAETYMAEFGRQQQPTMASESKKVYGLLFKKYSLAPAEARENMVYYSSDAKRIDGLYKDILQNLHDRQLGMDSTKARPGK